MLNVEILWNFGSQLKINFVFKSSIRVCNFACDLYNIFIWYICIWIYLAYMYYIHVYTWNLYGIYTWYVWICTYWYVEIRHNHILYMKSYTYAYEVLYTLYYMTFYTTNYAITSFWSHTSYKHLYYCISSYLRLNLIATKNPEYSQSKAALSIQQCP